MAVSEASIRAAYESHAKGSRALLERGARVLPGGDTRASAHYWPFPLCMARGEGARLWDVDGNEYADFMNNFTSLIHGHAHPAVTKAVAAQAARGTAFAAPSSEQIELAELLCARVPSLELVRFTSSGSEATEMAIRAARAFTGRPAVLKFEGGYHGSHELGEISVAPMGEGAGPADRPLPLPPDRSIPAHSLLDVRVAPFNDAACSAGLIREHADDLAAVILEPMLGGGGMIPPEPGFLEALREVTEEHGILLIFDEVITLRVRPGGMQQATGVMPDLTAMGKIIGGGLPVGAFGGRREVMQQFDPLARGGIFHASTFSGNALSMAAGLAALRALEPADHARLNALGERLRRGQNGHMAERGLVGRATGFGSLSHLHLGPGPPRDGRQSVAAARAASRVQRLLQLCLLRRGVFAAPRGMYCTSTPMTEADVDRSVAALGDALDELLPLVRAEFPALVSVDAGR